MKYCIGTSGYIYKDWQGLFYPKGLKQKDRLKYYSTQFNTVEINASFYRMQTKETYQKWAAETSDDFIFTVKIGKYVTHMKKLRPDESTAGYTKEFLDNCSGLGDKLGCVLIQLPPFMQYNLDYLNKYIELLENEKKERKIAFDTAVEFRHESWFIEPLYKLLMRKNIAWVSADSNVWPDEKMITADFAYLRFHGPGQLFASSYTNDTLMEYAKFVKAHEKMLKKIYIYFNNDVSAYSVANAMFIRKLLTGEEITNDEPKMF